MLGHTRRVLKALEYQDSANCLPPKCLSRHKGHSPSPVSRLVVGLSFDARIDAANSQTDRTDDTRCDGDAMPVPAKSTVWRQVAKSTAGNPQPKQRFQLGNRAKRKFWLAAASATEGATNTQELHVQSLSHLVVSPYVADVQYLVSPQC